MERRRLTEEQKQQWAIDGYIVLKGVHSAEETANLRREVDRLHRKYVLNNADADSKSGLDRRNVLPDGDAFIRLVDHPVAFGAIVELMGPYIQLSMAEAVVRPPNPGYKGFIHTDGGQAPAQYSRHRNKLAAPAQNPVLSHRRQETRLRQFHHFPRQPSAALPGG